ncbi:MAG: Bax inhibitor-1/YccA family protein [Elusimicrobiota bacterium]|jgi:uncharacterized YccA/Bax inhibitor family protein|nr:Bax inhibitor-1/YccA family protein [Elusimicrobiota bacterium]
MANPLLKDSVFEKSSQVQTATVFSPQQTMTISGTVNKSIILLVLLLVSAFFTWTHIQFAQAAVFPALIIAFVLAMVCCFKQNISPVCAPIYAVCEGVVLGYISNLFDAAYKGIVADAVFLTIVVLLCMLAAYRAGILRATPTFKKVVILSTLGIAVFYLVSMIISFFGVSIGYFDMGNSSGASFLINLVIVVIAALNFVLDFDMIEQGARYGSPKYMEWYCAFALMITLVWLYIEILRLLARRK